MTSLFAICFILFLSAAHAYSFATSPPQAAAVDPDVARNWTQIVQAHGYPVETHKATTEDGYILTVFRLPNPGKPVAFLQHGLLDSSFTWILNEPSESLAYILYDKGYDVFLGNNRGCAYSLEHTHLTPADKEFWQFSFDEFARYDLPAMLQLALSISQQQTLHYIGHSQGTTQMWAALSYPSSLSPLLPQTIRSYLASFTALGPAANVTHIASPVLLDLAKWDVGVILSVLGFKQFLPPPTLLKSLYPDFCTHFPMACEDVVEAICGPHKGAFNESRMSVMASHEPGGTSIQNIIHWSQEVRDHTFAMYDFGELENEKRYGQKTNPRYDLRRLKDLQPALPIFIAMGGEDLLADPTDVNNLIAVLDGDNVQVIKIDDYAHLDFSWAISAATILYPQVLDFISQN